MSNTIRIPARFIDDHHDRGLPTPSDSSDSHRYALIRCDDPALAELLNDAEHYAIMTERRGRYDCMPRGIVASAAATVRAIRNVIGWDDASPAIRELRK
jgi:hypothetical protein